MSLRSFRDRTWEFEAKLEAVRSSSAAASSPSATAGVGSTTASSPSGLASGAVRGGYASSSSSLGSSGSVHSHTSGVRPLPSLHGPSGALGAAADDLPTHEVSLEERGHKFSQPSKFALAARDIGADIHHITHKLERLGKLAKRRSLFQDKTEEIQELTHEIKVDITRVKGDIDVLEEWVNRHHGSRGASRQSDSHSHTIVDTLKSKLATSTKNFSEILQIRTQNLKKQSSRGKNYYGSGSTTASRQLRHRKVPSLNAMDMTYDEDDEDGGDGGGQVAQQQDMIEQDTYLSSRVEAVEQIESTIVELGEMYKRLNVLVQMQNEITVRIDANMDDTLQNVEEGHAELMKYFESMSGNRWLIIKVFSVLILFALFFTMFVA